MKRFSMPLLILLIVLLGLGFFIYWHSFPKPTGPRGITSKECKRTGCNGEICADKDTKLDFTTACWRLLEHHCYQKTDCVQQANGKCGFKQSPRFRICLFFVKTLQDKEREEINDI